MAPPKGNKYAAKKMSDELKQEAYKQYCAHIAAGKSEKSWCFEHPETSLTWETMESYMRANPDVFPPIHKKIAESKSMDHWMSLGKKMMLGKIEGKIQPAIYQMFMRNMFGWDKNTLEVTTNKESVKDDILKLRNQRPSTAQANTTLKSETVALLPRIQRED